MITLEDAIELALLCHKNQKDKSGNPYILHPLHVMSKMKTTKQKIIAVLHDVVEDFFSKLGEQAVEDFYNNLGDVEISEALKALTRLPNEEYNDFIVRVSKNLYARRVKIADIEHNMDLTRLNSINEKDIKRFMKYKRCKEFLECHINYTFEFTWLDKTTSKEEKNTNETDNKI